MRPRIGLAPRWVAPLFALLALALLPWTVWLARVLPDHHLSAHWNVAWAGFDLGLATALLGTAVAALRRSPWLEGSAMAAGTLLVVDAWFDLLTASGGAELIVAAAEAAVVELPVAVLCFWIARDAKRFLERAQGCLERSGARPESSGYGSGSKDDPDRPGRRRHGLRRRGRARLAPAAPAYAKEGIGR